MDLSLIQSLAIVRKFRHLNKIVGFNISNCALPSKRSHILLHVFYITKGIILRGNLF